MSFEEAMKELEATVGKLETGDASLDESIKLYERGALLRQHCEFNYIETGAILREMPADSEIGRLIARGDFVPDKYLFDLMQSKIICHFL